MARGKSLCASYYEPDTAKDLMCVIVLNSENNLGIWALLFPHFNQ